MTEGMRAFAKKYNRSLDDPKLRALYELEMSAQRDQKAIAYTERMEGRAEGRVEGTAAAYYSVIHGMLNNGIPVDVIYKCVNAPRSEVDAIIAKVRAEEKQ